MTMRLHKKGFTLAELLVAVAVVATVVAVAYGSYAAATGSADAYNARIAARRQQQTLLRQLSRQLRTCFVPASLPQEPDAAPVISTAANLQTGWQAQQTFKNETDYFTGGCNGNGIPLLHFVTTTRVFPQPEVPQGLYEVAYRFERATGTIYTSQEIFVPRTGNIERHTNWRPVAHGVRELKLRFFDGENWHSSYSYHDTKELPLAVHIEITFEDKNHRELGCGTTILPLCRRTGAKTHSVQR